MEIPIADVENKCAVKAAVRRRCAGERGCEGWRCCLWMMRCRCQCGCDAADCWCWGGCDDMCSACSVVRWLAGWLSEIAWWWWMAAAVWSGGSGRGMSRLLSAAASQQQLRLMSAPIEQLLQATVSLWFDQSARGAAPSLTASRSASARPIPRASFELPSPGHAYSSPTYSCW